MSEIRMFEIENLSETQTFLCLVFRHTRCLKSKQNFLNFSHFTKVSEIQTKSLDFRHNQTENVSETIFWETEQYLKSILVWISDNYCKPVE